MSQIHSPSLPSASAAVGKGAPGGNVRVNPGSSSDDVANREATKRLAQQGQWRTPPLPVFAAGSGASGGIGPALAASNNASMAAAAAASSGVAAAAAATVSAPLPTSPDEYARMLQEAYRRGAEAGKRATSTTPPTQSITTGGDTSQTSSCPSFSKLAPPALQQQQQQQYVVLQPGVASPIPVAASASAAPVAVLASSAPVGTPSPLGVPFTSAAGYANAQHPAYAAVSVQQQQQQPYTPHAAVAAMHPPTSIATTDVGVAPSPVNVTSVSLAARSQSLPDMSAYAKNANDEEDKRKKRLARNRASARLRRLKKKNLVDSYEGEVGVLETALSKLRSHRWGVGTDHEALIEALSMERGQQPLTPEKRKALITSILEQQREQVANLMECQLENYMLGVLAGGGAGIKADPDGGDDDMAQLTSELSSVLNLTPDQKNRISRASEGCEGEIRDLQVVDNCLASMLSNEWLVNEGVDEVAGQFTSILNPAQVSKFLLWSDHNADAIEKLEYVNAVPGGGVPENGPMFEFGIDEGMEGCEEKM